MRGQYSDVMRSAHISPDGVYRWSLFRSFKEGNGRKVCFVMLNPSTADAEVDDPTIRRCMGFAHRWGCTHLVVRNLFPYRATKPKDLLNAYEPGGGDRGYEELAKAAGADLVVAAWGAWVPFGREEHAIVTLNRAGARNRMYCLGLTKEGKPRHPLYVKADTELQLFNPISLTWGRSRG